MANPGEHRTSLRSIRQDFQSDPACLEGRTIYGVIRRKPCADYPYAPGAAAEFHAGPAPARPGTPCPRPGPEVLPPSLFVFQALPDRLQRSAVPSSIPGLEGRCQHQTLLPIARPSPRSSHFLLHLPADLTGCASRASPIIPTTSFTFSPATWTPRRYFSCSLGSPRPKPSVHHGTQTQYAHALSRPVHVTFSPVHNRRRHSLLPATRRLHPPRARRVTADQRSYPPPWLPIPPVRPSPTCHTATDRDLSARAHPGPRIDLS